MGRHVVTVGSLFSGIGGFDLGFERAGYEITWQVEIDPYATRVLAKHWPDVTRYGDIRSIDWGTVAPVDVICGGFPCQPHSLAGKRGGSTDDRDLWGEFVRAIRAIRPRWIVAENVPGLLSSESGRFFGRILRDLAASGYDAKWDCLPACALGAPHRRDRVWIVAYADTGRFQERAVPIQRAHERPEWNLTDADWASASLADADDPQLERWPEGPGRRDGRQELTPAGDIFGGRIQADEQWATEPDVGRVAHGVPARVDRLKGLGNAVVPQVVQFIAERIKG